MAIVESIIKRAEERCKSRGVRLTEKRKQVLIGLLKSKKALSAYELADYCKDLFGQNIPPMSVYRTLDLLQSEQLVHRLNLSNKYIACSHIACDHKHDVPQFLICNQCNSVKEVAIKSSFIESLEKSVEEADYTLVSPQLELNCICSSCASKS